MAKEKEGNFQDVNSKTQKEMKAYVLGRVGVKDRYSLGDSQEMFLHSLDFLCVEIDRLKQKVSHIANTIYGKVQ